MNRLEIAQRKVNELDARAERCARPCGASTTTSTIPEQLWYALSAAYSELRAAKSEHKFITEES